MKFFEEPEMEVVKFVVEDMITTSTEETLAIQPCIS